MAKSFNGLGYAKGELLAQGLAATSILLTKKALESKGIKYSKKEQLKDKRDIAKSNAKFTATAYKGLLNFIGTVNKYTSLATYKNILNQVSDDVIDSWDDFFNDKNNSEKKFKELKNAELGNKLPKMKKKPEFLMCSTLIVLAYQGAGIDFNMTDSYYIGTDDLYYFCKKNFAQKFDVSFDKATIVDNK